MQYVLWKKKLKLLVKNWIKTLIQFWFQVEVQGTYVPTANSVIIANRTSKMDLLLLAAFLPEKLTVALHPEATGFIWMRLMRAFADVMPIDSSRAYAAKALVKAIKQGRRCVIFPQGTVLQEESLKVYDGPAIILKNAQADILPIRISGPQHSVFSISKDKHRIYFRPKVSLHLLSVQRVSRISALPITRQEMSLWLFSLISDLTFANSFQPKSVFSALLDGAKLGTKNKTKIEDSSRVPLRYSQFITRCFILGRQLKKKTKVQEYVGVMMPTTIAGMVTFFALNAYRRIPAMLNFSMGFNHIYSACQTAKIKQIFTSKQFINSAKLESLVAELQHVGLVIYFLEDFKPQIKVGHKVMGLLKATIPSLAYKLIGKAVDPEDTGVILFTSGSEGTPKGVLLSHSNLIANCWQLTSRVDFSSRDTFFNALPIFHCFGLTTGAILPLITGINCFLYPSPLHYKIIPGLVYQSGATIMLGTDTFLTGYARAAANHDFSSIRYIFAGAEKVKPETIRYWNEKFGVKIYEGYGATETSPVISMNCPLAYRLGSVGMILPQIENRIDVVEGITDGGRLFLRGPNIMRGYLSTNPNIQLIPPTDGWHDTGDIVTVDAAQFITILGRAKRFAKIAGEMVSLTAVEAIASSIWSELLHAAISIKSDKKGEQIVLFTEKPHPEKSIFIKKVKEQHVSELHIPTHIIAVSTIPVLSSGKIDYVSLEKQVVNNII